VIFRKVSTGSCWYFSVRLEPEALGTFLCTLRGAAGRGAAPTSRWRGAGEGPFFGRGGSIFLDDGALASSDGDGGVRRPRLHPGPAWPESREVFSFFLVEIGQSSI